jgi:hypothetical protein
MTSALAAKAPLNNPSFTGSVLLPNSSPTLALQAASKGYVDNTIATADKKIIYFTRNMVTGGAGNQSYNGLGFRPSLLQFFGGADVTTIVLNFGVWGIDGVGGDVARYGANYVARNSEVIFLSDGSYAHYASVYSLDADGFTLTWAVNGTISATAKIWCICWR